MSAIRWFVLTLGMLASGALLAQSYPSKAVRIVVGFSPGGSADILARLIGQPLSERLGQPFVVENRPGAGGSIAAGVVAKAAADGHTLFLASTSHTINATYYKRQLSYDTVADFSGVATIAIVPYALVVNPALSARSLTDLVALARANPAKLNFGSSGNGTATHLAGEMFKTMAGIRITHVPYKGPAEQIQDVVAGRVEMTIVPVNAAKSFVDSGRLVAVGVTTSERSAALADVPTFAEAGITGYEFTPWFGLLAPAGTPRAAVDRLNEEIKRVLESSEIRGKLLNQGAQPLALKPAQFDALMRSEVAKLGKLLAEAGVAPN